MWKKETNEGEDGWPVTKGMLGALDKIEKERHNERIKPTKRPSAFWKVPRKIFILNR